MIRVLGGILIFGLILIAFGCTSKELTKQDFVGIYVANYDKNNVVSDVIEVKSDGTYTHDFKSPDEKKNFANSGTWNFSYVNGKPKLVFINFMVGYSPYTKYFGGEKELMRPGFWLPPVEDNGKRLIIDDDLGLHYDKQK